MPWFWPLSKTHLKKSEEPKPKPKVTVLDLLNRAIQKIYREEFHPLPDPQTISMVGRPGLLSSSITLVSGEDLWVAQVVWKNGKIYRVLHEEIPPEEIPPEESP